MRFGLRVKLYGLLFLSVIGMAIIVAVSSNNMNWMIAQLINTQYNQSFVNSSLVLNADRDAYQAVMAWHEMLAADPNSEWYKMAKDKFEENIGQVKERIGDSEQAMKDVDLFYTGIKGTESQVTAKEAYASFYSDLDIWEKEARRIIQMHEQDPNQDLMQLYLKNDAQFDVFRESINAIGELLDLYAKETAQEAQRQKSILIMIIIGAGVVTLLLLGGGSIVIIRSVLASVFRVKSQLDLLADGQLNLEQPKNRGGDEVAYLATTVYRTSQSLRSLIQEIMDSSSSLVATSEELSQSSHEIFSHMQGINKSTSNIALGLETVSASAEEVNASSQEMNASIHTMTDEAQRGRESTLLIEKRAREVEESVKMAKVRTDELYGSIKNQVMTAIEKAKVVEEISNLADSISGIAGQTNLLALNAAIEAARAGEQGRGFAVVAEEVRKLASESSSTVTVIQDTIKQVQEAIANLTSSTNQLLKFINESVIEAYDSFVETGQQYRNDAAEFRSVTERVTGMSNQVLESIGEVSHAMESVAVTISESAINSREISNSTEGTSRTVSEIAELAAHLEESAVKLSELVKRFKL